MDFKALPVFRHLSWSNWQLLTFVSANLANSSSHFCGEIKKVFLQSNSIFEENSFFICRNYLNTNHCCHSNCRIVIRYTAACDFLTILIMHIHKFLLQLAGHWNQLRFYTAFAPCLRKYKQIICWPWICSKTYCNKQLTPLKSGLLQAMWGPFLHCNSSLQ